MKELVPKYNSRKSFYRKAIIEYRDDVYYLYSYEVEVFMIPFDDDKKMKLLWNGYSATTYSHIREFIKQYAGYNQKKGLSDTITKKEIESFI